MAIYPHGNKVRLDCQIKGKRYVRSFATREEAAAWQAKAKALIALGLPADDRADAAQDMTVGEALAAARTQWLRQKDGRGSIANGADVVNALGASTSLTALRKHHLDAMVTAFLEKGMAPATVNRKLAALSKMLNCARDAGVPITARVVRLQEPKGRLRFLSFFEEQSVFTYYRDNGNPAMGDAVTTAIDTGLRLSELLAIRKTWVRQEAGGAWVLTVPSAVTKTGEARTIPLTPRVQEVLERRMASSMTPWPESWNVDKVGAMWSTMRAALGLQDDPEFVFHACRHTCATRLLEKTDNLALVCKWLGHSDIRTTSRYAKVVSSTLKAGVQALIEAAA